MKNIKWLDNFAESYAKQVKRIGKVKTASKKVAAKEDVIVSPDEINQDATVGSVINYNGKLYRIADLNYSDEQGPGVVLNEVEEELEKNADMDEDIESLNTEESTETVEETEEIEETEDPENSEVEETEQTVEEVNINDVTKDPMEMAMGNYDSKISGGQQYSRLDPGNVYDNGTISNEEVEKYQNDEIATKEQINMENSIDRTTPYGRYTINKREQIIEEDMEFQATMASMNNRILRRIICKK